MSYIDGFIIPVEDARRDEFIEHANRVDRLFLEFGATAVVEGWGDDVPEGKRTDFRRAVDLKPGESVVFAWIAWPDKATRDAAMKRAETDERMMAEPMPFDGKRMVFGGFAPLLDETLGDGETGYVDGLLLPVREDRKEDYRRFAMSCTGPFAEHGATALFEGWGEDLPTGEVTDLRRAVQAEEGETVVFSFIRWPDKATRDAGWAKMMEAPPPADQPFDGQRMFWGGFNQIVDLKA